MQANSSVMVLVSCGQHPLSGRARRAESDAKALELALKLEEGLGEAPAVIFAGDPDSLAIREYLGMGVKQLDVLKVSQDADASLALADHVSARKPNIVLCGARAEWGESSGMVPYLVAQSLSATVVPDVVDVLTQTETHAEVLQALSGGQRRRLRITLPAVLLASGAAPEPRQSAFTKARDGIVNVLQVAAHKDELAQAWQWQVAKKKPKRVKTVAASASGRDRFLAATAAPVSSGGQVMNNPSPQDAAEAILVLLKKEGVI
ncbi:electron transfer flavoprotein subunit beta [Enterovibrio sp. FF113]|uniref:electron transfer flavoprotein subunit beta n=1 Tax=Enterovibrio sp. FF113 TaxID=3230010 RepID=UPI00352FEE71